MRCAHPAGEHPACRASRSSNSATASAGPDTTQLPGSFTAAISRPGDRCSVTSSGPSATATITPLGAACISRARADTAVIAVGQIEDARQSGRDVLADAVPGQRRRCERRRTRPAPRARIRREERGLSVIGAGQVGAPPLEYLHAQVDAEFVVEALGAPVEMLGEYRLGLIEAARHRRRVARPARGTGRPPGRPDSGASTDSPSNTLSCSSACSTRAACLWLCTTAAALRFSARLPASVNATSDSSGGSGPASSVPSSERSSRSPSAVRADSSRTWGPGRLSSRRCLRGLLDDDVHIGTAHPE